VPVDAPPPPFVDPPPPSLPAAATIITDTALLSTITPAFGTLPLAFVPNAGQTRDRRVQFQANYDGSTLLFSPDSVVLLLARRVPDVPGSGIGNGDSNDNSNGNGQGQAKQRNDDKGTVFLVVSLSFRHAEATRFRKTKFVIRDGLGLRTSMADTLPATVTPSTGRAAAPTAGAATTRPTR